MGKPGWDNASAPGRIGVGWLLDSTPLGQRNGDSEIEVAAGEKACGQVGPNHGKSGGWL